MEHGSSERAAGRGQRAEGSVRSLLLDRGNLIIGSEAMSIGRSESASSSNASNSNGHASSGVESAYAASAALRALLEVGSSQTGGTTAAVAALEFLRARLDSSATTCVKLASAAGQVASAQDDATQAIGGVEQWIIETKVKLGDLLETKDIVARELWKAKREFECLPEVDEETATKVPPVVDGIEMENGDPGATGFDAGATDGTVSDQTGMTEILDAKNSCLEDQAQQELARLAVLDTEIVQVTDEMNTVRKKRAVLEEKLSTAYNEF